MGCVSSAHRFFSTVFAAPSHMILGPRTLERVQMVLGHFRTSTSPGLRGIPIRAGRPTADWPDELLQVYVATILKASHGTRPQEQHPITFLDVAHPIWATRIMFADFSMASFSAAMVSVSVGHAALDSVAAGRGRSGRDVEVKFGAEESGWRTLVAFRAVAIELGGKECVAFPAHLALAKTVQRSSGPS